MSGCFVKQLSGLVRPRRGRNIAVPFYARGGVQPMYADAIVIFRGRGIGVYLDW